jgi:hypothetical protein
MNDEALMNSTRRFLKTVGVNSQIAIEKAVQQALECGRIRGDELLPAKMMLTVGRIEVSIEFEGELRLT